MVLSVALVVGGFGLAGFLRQHSDSLQKLYQGDTRPVLMRQPGGWVRTISAEWIPQSVAWSPDGQRLAMCAMPKMAMRKFFRMPTPVMFDPRRQRQAGMKWALEIMGPRVVVIDLTTGEEQTVFSVSGEVMAMPGEVVWFPDGQRLAVVTSPMPTDYSEEEPPSLQLWTLSVDGSNLQKVGDGAKYLAVSADGKWIAYLGTVRGRENHLSVVPAEGGPEIPVSEQSVIKMAWHKQQDILYFRCRGEPKQWWRMRIPEGSAKTMALQMIEATDRTGLGNVDFVGVHTYEGERPGEPERYRLCATDLAAGRHYVVSPFFDAPATALGPCLDHRYILLRGNDDSPAPGDLLWVYRLADDKFYQVTDDRSLKAYLQKGYSPVDSTGTRVYLEQGPMVPDPFEMFTTGFSVPVMVLQLDEKAILSQPGCDEPVATSSNNQGVTQ